MDTFLDVSGIVKRAKQALNFKKDSELASYLGVSRGRTDGSELTSERKNPSNKSDSNVFAPVGVHPDRGDFQFRGFVRLLLFSRGYSNALSSVPLYESRSNFSISDSRYSTFPHIM